jgi:hypothetical protein
VATLGKGDGMARKETFAQATHRLLGALASVGWATKPELEVPQAVARDGTVILFKTQSVYCRTPNGAREYSLFIDRRDMSLDRLLDYVMKHTGQGQGAA